MLPGTFIMVLSHFMSVTFLFQSPSAWLIATDLYGRRINLTINFLHVN